MPEEQASPEAQQSQSPGIPPSLVIEILQQRAQRDKELNLHIEAAILQAANQIQQQQIQQLQAEPAPAKAPAKKKPATKRK